jgi:hypothetical protein
MTDSFFSGAAARIVANAVEVGLTSDTMSIGQKDEYERFLELLKNVLSDHETALFALERILERPNSKGARFFLEEELEELETSEFLPVYSEVVNLAEKFLTEVQEQVITQHGIYSINFGGSKGLIVGDSSIQQNSF